MRRFDTKVAKLKADVIVEAEAALSRYLHECFPIGARCMVMLSVSQINPTPATIVGISPNRYGGSVNVQIDTAKPRSRLRFRTIPACDVSEVAAQAEKGKGE